MNQEEEESLAQENPLTGEGNRSLWPLNSPFDQSKRQDSYRFRQDSTQNLKKTTRNIREKTIRSWRREKQHQHQVKQDSCTKQRATFNDSRKEKSEIWDQEEISLFLLFCFSEKDVCRVLRSLFLSSTKISFPSKTTLELDDEEEEREERSVGKQGKNFASGTFSSFLTRELQEEEEEEWKNQIIIKHTNTSDTKSWFLSPWFFSLFSPNKIIL